MQYFQRFKVIFDYLSVDFVLKQASILEEVTTRSCVGIKVHLYITCKTMLGPNFHVESQKIKNLTISSHDAD